MNHVAKTISLLTSCMPVRLEVFLQVSFSCFCYIIHVVSFIQETLEKRSFKFLSKHLVLLLYGNEYRNLFCTQNNVFVVDEESRGWGIVSFCVHGVGE